MNAKDWNDAIESALEKLQYDEGINNIVSTMPESCREITKHAILYILTLKRAEILELKLFEEDITNCAHTLNAFSKGGNNQAQIITTVSNKWRGYVISPDTEIK